MGTPLSGAQNTRGWGKFSGFRLKSPFIWETVRNGPWLLWNVNRKSGSIRVNSGDLEWLERRDVRGQFFQVDLHNNARTVWPRTTKFCMWGGLCYLGAATSLWQVGGVQVLPQFWGSFLYRARQEECPLKNFANFSRTIERYDIKNLHAGYTINPYMWKYSLHYLQNWQNYVAFSHGNLAVKTLSKTASTIQYRANAVSANTFWVEKNVQKVFRHRLRTLLSNYF